MGEYAGLAAIGAIAIILSIVLYQRSIRREREDMIASREKLEAKSYIELQKDYRNAIRNIERNWRGAVVIDLINDISEHREGRDRLPVRISYEIAFEVAERIRSAKKRPIVVILHTLGGYAFPSEMIAQALKNYPGRKTAYVPYVAMSGGTEIALATDTVHMGPDAALGPIDAQYFGFPAAAYKWLVGESKKSKDHIDDSTLLLSYMIEQREKDARERAFTLLNDHHKKDKQDKYKVIDALMDETKHHGSRISADAAEKLGIRVARSCPKEVYTLVDSRLRMLKKVEEKAAAEHSLLQQSAAPPAG